MDPGPAHRESLAGGGLRVRETAPSVSGSFCIRPRYDPRTMGKSREVGRQPGGEHDPLAVADEFAIERAAKVSQPTERPGGRRVPMLKLPGGRLAALKPGTRIKLDRAEVDVCFVFDTTGSMSDKIDGLVACMTDFVEAFSQLALDWRCTCVPFGDLTVPGDRVDAQLPFVATADEAKLQLRQMPRFSGGGNTGESSIEAMLAAIGKPWRQEAVRVLVLLTDEPALEVRRAQQILEKLQADEIICFAASPPEAYYRDWAQRNGGQWTAIGPQMDTAELLNLLRSLVRDVAQVARDVHQLAGGSVRKYLQLEAGNSHPARRSP